MTPESSMSSRSLADIEGDLLKAEAAYADADARLRHAERERQSALLAINEHQAEFDEAVALLRRRSTRGSRWSANSEQLDELTLTEEEALPDEADVTPVAGAELLQRLPYDQ